ncbi:MAG: hypothetical protein LQ343_007332 [Gyalolechia ehrenbergii]|nr:MAG: hypothetical protein LQ343_007332 [Gyalolechia ehrenbergii]
MTPTPTKSLATKDTASPAPSSRSSVETADAPTSSIPTAYVSDKADDSSKLRTFLSILRKFIGVADIASVRFSLPAQLLEPTPNLEYWNYLDRPETFISIGDSDDALGRMLAVLRFWFTKDLKYVKGKPCKPYNSALGEFFRCNWEVEDSSPSIVGDGPKVSATGEVSTEHKTVRVSYITEQTSHHPPVSAFWVDCPVKGISAYGFDQLSAKFTGTSVRVIPGAHNLGIFINLQHRNNEEYRLTHPAAYLAGMLRGSLSITVADTCYVTCPKSRIKVILHYLEEGWLGKTQNRVLGVVFSYDPEIDNKFKIKDVPEKDVLARIEGCWQDKIYYTLKDAKDPQLLIDLNPLWPIPKVIPPENQQLSNESRRFWRGVTEAILNKQYGQATKLKQELEERQREKATARKDQGSEWKPRFFTEALVPNGKPNLSEDGRRALKGLQEGDYHLEESAIMGA